MATNKKRKLPVPGVPSSEAPSYEEPTTPAGPVPPKDDQGGPDTLTPTGVSTGQPPESVGQQGEFLTTAHGARLSDSDHSLRAGRRGPTLLQDHHLREKVSHFDHERIPERVVHARGAGAHGVFEANGAAEGICQAGFLQSGVETPVFVRFSTVLGSRGSADLARDTRGFATRFYTAEGNYDLIGNNIPVFFIQDGIKFPDVSTPPSLTPTGRSRRRRARTTRSGTSPRCTPRRRRTQCGTCPTAASPGRSGRWRASASTPGGSRTPTGRPAW